MPTVHPSSRITWPVFVPLPKRSRCLSQPWPASSLRVCVWAARFRRLPVLGFESETVESAGVGRLP